VNEIQLALDRRLGPAPLAATTATSTARVTIIIRRVIVTAPCFVPYAVAQLSGAFDGSLPALVALGPLAGRHARERAARRRARSAPRRATATTRRRARRDSGAQTRRLDDRGPVHGRADHVGLELQGSCWRRRRVDPTRASVALCVGGQASSTSRLWNAMASSAARRDERAGAAREATMVPRAC